MKNAEKIALTLLTLLKTSSSPSPPADDTEPEHPDKSSSSTGQKARQQLASLTSNQTLQLILILHLRITLLCSCKPIQISSVSVGAATLVWYLRRSLLSNLWSSCMFTLNLCVEKAKKKKIVD